MSYPKLQKQVTWSSWLQRLLTRHSDPKMYSPNSINLCLLKFAQIHAHWVSDAFNHLILCCLLLLLPSIIPRIRVFSKELALRIRWPKYWSFSFWPLHSCGPPRDIYASARRQVGWTQESSLMGSGPQHRGGQVSLSIWLGRIGSLHIKPSVKFLG